MERSASDFICKSNPKGIAFVSFRRTARAGGADKQKEETMLGSVGKEYEPVINGRVCKRMSKWSFAVCEVSKRVYVEI